MAVSMSPRSMHLGMMPAMHAELAEFPYARTVERVRIRCSKIENIGLLGASACHE